MSDETKCPHGCGADIETTCRDGTILWTCGVVRKGDYLSKQSDRCRITQLEQKLSVSVAALKNIRGGCACQGICHCASVEAAEALKQIGVTE